MSQIDKNATNEINDKFQEDFINYLNIKQKLGSKTKGLLDYIKDDPSLIEKITFDKAILENPILLNNIENTEHKETCENYLDTKENSKVDNKVKTLTNNM